MNTTTFYLISGGTAILACIFSYVIGVIDGRADIKQVDHIKKIVSDSILTLVKELVENGILDENKFTEYMKKYK